MTGVMVEALVEEVAAEATYGKLQRFPAGVSFGPISSELEGSGLIYAWTNKPDTLFESAHGYTAWFEEYTPTPEIVRRSIRDLIRLVDLQGDKLNQAVDKFVRQYGHIAYDSRYIHELRGWPYRMATEVEEMIRQDQKLMVVGIPLESYKHEAREMLATLDLYEALLANRVSEIPDWEWAWARLLQRIHPYLSFVRYGTDWQDNFDRLRATSPDNLIPYRPKQQVIALNLLGAMYSHVLQMVLDQRLVKRCAADGCNVLFEIENRSDQQYCSMQCSNRTRQRRYKQRRRQKGL